MIKHVYGSTELCKKFNRYWVALNECVTIFIRVGIWLLTKTGQILIILTLQIYRLNTANGCMLSTIHFRVTFSQYRPSEHMFRATPRMAYCPPPLHPTPLPQKSTNNNTTETYARYSGSGRPIGPPGPANLYRLFPSSRRQCVQQLHGCSDCLKVTGQDVVPA